MLTLPLWGMLILFPFDNIEAASTPPVTQYCIEGISSELKALVNTKIANLPSDTQHSIQQHIEKTAQAIQTILKAHGYFRAHIQSHFDPLSHTITHAVTQGEPLLITTLNIQLQGAGKSDTAVQKNIQQLHSEHGQIMTTHRYQSIKNALYTTLVSQGFLETTWRKHTVAIDLEKYTATISLALDTGPRYTVGPIQLPKILLNELLLKRYLTFKENDPYDLSQLLHSETLLEKSGYFQHVRIPTLTTPSQTRVPLAIQLKMARKYHTLVGLGLDTDFGLRLRGEGTIRYLNAWGHQLSSIIQIVGRRFEGTGLYTIPGHLPTIQSHHIAFKYRNFYPNSDTAPHQKESTRLDRFALQHGTTILRYLYTQQHLKWKYTHFTSLHHENFITTPQQQKNQYTGFIFGAMVCKKDNPQYATLHHYNAKSKLQWAFKPLSTLHFLKYELKATYMGRVLPKMPSSYLFLRGRVGTLFTPTFANIPPSLRFYAGGYRYPRGYKEYSLGAHTVGGGLELRLHLGGLFYINPFIETNFTTTSTKASTGLGLCLWYPPIGHIEVGGVLRSHPALTQSRYGMIIKISSALH